MLKFRLAFAAADLNVAVSRAREREWELDGNAWGATCWSVVEAKERTISLGPYLFGKKIWLRFVVGHVANVQAIPRLISRGTP